MRREFLLLFILCVLFFSQVPTSSSAQQPDETSNYFTLAIEATDWITEFQFTPMGSSWGTHYNNSKVWGLDPFVNVNGTITGGYPKIPAGGKQTLGYLIGGHDSGEAASAALEAYLHTHNEKYLHLFQVYLDYFKRSQMPSRFVYTIPFRYMQTRMSPLIILDTLQNRSTLMQVQTVSMALQTMTCDWSQYFPPLNTEIR